jgi:hypothetical protein
MRFSNMSIKLISVVLVVFLFSSLYASETRVATMGSNGLYVKDNSNIMMFPGLLLSYSQLVISELRPNFGTNRQQDYSIGIHMDYGDMASALYINQPISSTILGIGLQAFNDIPGAPNLSSELNNAYVFMFALKLAGFDAGFGLVTAGTSVDNGVVEEKSTYLAILAGLSSKKLDVGIRAELPSIEVSNGGKTEFSGFALNGQARYQLMTMNGAHIFPVGQFGFGSASYKDGFEVDFSGLMFSVGIGMEKPINEDNLLIVGLDGFSYETLEINSKTTDVTQTTTTITFPAIYLGLESRISSWLIGRLGVRHTNVSVTDEQTGADDQTDDGSTFHLALGLGMEFGNFLIDFGMNEGLLFDGPYIFSHTNGASSPNGSISQFASKISITYNFGGEEDEKE